MKLTNYRGVIRVLKQHDITRARFVQTSKFMMLITIPRHVSKPEVEWIQQQLNHEAAGNTVYTVSARLGVFRNRIHRWTYNGKALRKENSKDWECTPVNFPEQSHILPEADVMTGRGLERKDLPIQITPTMITTCWQMNSWKARIAALLTGRVYIMCNGHILPIMGMTFHAGAVREKAEKPRQLTAQEKAEGWQHLWYSQLQRRTITELYGSEPMFAILKDTGARVEITDHSNSKKCPFKWHDGVYLGIGKRDYKFEVGMREPEGTKTQR